MVREASLNKVGHPITLEGWAVLEKNFFCQSCRLTPKTYRGGSGRVRGASLKKVGHPITLEGWAGPREKLFQQKL